MVEAYDEQIAAQTQALMTIAAQFTRLNDLLSDYLQFALDTAAKASRIKSLQELGELIDEIDAFKIEGRQQ